MCWQAVWSRKNVNKVYQQFAYSTVNRVIGLQQIYSILWSVRSLFNKLYKQMLYFSKKVLININKWYDTKGY